MKDRFKWLLAALLFVLAVLVIGGSMLSVQSCGSSPTAPVEPMPRTSEEGEQLYLNRMHRSGNAIPSYYCWSWYGVDGHVYTQCRWANNPLFDPQ